ncbi:MAG: hypothetical protein DRJ66_04715 [Thermoprotei archaeon]|nr:MAG: hypothetical protein DRJ66_04715 [Thermoprotei archaeon]RLF19517.1 MAG: hypothetical protein DRZ82_05445 [Thermoprotei archaeon]
MKEFHAKTFSFLQGTLSGRLLISKTPLSFYGDIDVSSGVIINPRHDLYGETLSGKILLIPHSSGSTVGPYIIYALSQKGLAPRAILTCHADSLTAIGCIIGNIWYIYDVPESLLDERYHGIRVEISVRSREAVIKVNV